MKPRHATSLIESAYRLDLTTPEWLESIVASASEALESTQGGMAFQYDASSGNWVNTGIPVLRGLSPAFAQEFFNQKDVPPEVSAQLARAFMSVQFGSAKEMFERIGAWGAVGPVFERHGIADLVGINGPDPTGRGCSLAIAVPWKSYGTRTVQLWHRLGAHISAGNRLRKTLEDFASKDADPSKIAEAVLSSNGTVEHAVGPAEPRAAREALRKALVRIDTARSERDDTDRSVELWRGLVAGRWSLVEHFERDGRRYFLAHKNDPELAPDRALSKRERQVLSYAELGQSNKLIGYALGLSQSTVSTMLARARKKLGESR